MARLVGWYKTEQECSIKESVAGLVEKWIEVLCVRLNANLRPCLRACFVKMQTVQFEMLLEREQMEKAWKTVDLLTDFVLHESEDFLRGYLQLRALFVSSSVQDRTLEALGELYAFLSFCGVQVEQHKYWTNLVFNKIMKESELPEHKDFLLGERLLDPTLARLLRVHSRGDRPSRKAMVFANTVFQGWKKGWLPCRVTKLIESAKAQEETLGRASPPLSETQQRLLDRYVRELRYRTPWDVRVTQKAGIEPVRLSSKATIEQSRGAGGNLGYLLDRYFDSCLSGATRSLLELKELRNPMQDPCMRNYWLASEDHLVSMYESRYDVERYSGARYQAISGPVRERRACILDRDLYYSALQELRDVVAGVFPEVRPSGIAEPGKFRMISVPHVLDYAPLQNIQRELWSNLHEKWTRRTFRLTSETISSEVITEWLDDSQAWLGRRGIGLDLDQFVSGDYTGATDRVNGSCSNYLAAQLLHPVAGSDPRLAEWAEMSLTSTLVRASELKEPSYDAFSQTGGKQLSRDFEDLKNRIGLRNFEQKNGQLMGHVLSFPLLCHLNYLAYHHSWERYLRRELPFFSGPPPCLVNGDDIVFRSNKKHYECWKSVIGEWGFVMSPGKNFSSSFFVQMNSTLFAPLTLERRRIHTVSHLSCYDLGTEAYGCYEERSRWKAPLIGYYSFAVLTGRGKGRDAEDGKGWTQSGRLERLDRDLKQLLATVTANKAFRGSNERSHRQVLDSDSPALMAIASYPLLVQDSLPPGPLGSVGERFLAACNANTSGIQSRLPFLPWQQMFIAIRDGDSAKFNLWNRFFGTFAPKLRPVDPFQQALGLCREIDVVETYLRSEKRCQELWNADLDSLAWMLEFDGLRESGCLHGHDLILESTEHLDKQARRRISYTACAPLREEEHVEVD